MIHIPSKIISGGQTGVDIGALVGARKAGITTGGNAPRGFMTEKGSQAEVLKSFGLIEHPSDKYPPRTKENIKNSCVTLILATNELSTGTKLATEHCKFLGRPFLVVNPFNDSVRIAADFINKHQPSILNIAGNRQSTSNGIAEKTVEFVFLLFGKNGN